MHRIMYLIFQVLVLIKRWKETKNTQVFKQPTSKHVQNTFSICKLSLYYQKENKNVNLVFTLKLSSKNVFKSNFGLYPPLRSASQFVYATELDGHAVFQLFSQARVSHSF